MIHKTTLENGIRVITEPLPAVRSIAMGFLIDAGPADEPPDKSGLAHLVEHAMFNGTSSRSATQISRFMDEAGGSLGAFTTRDYTCFTATVLDDYHPYALDLMGDILLNSTYPEEKLEREKSAIINEIDTAGDIPGQRVHALLKEFIWPDHPLGRSITGSGHSVRNLTREDIIYFVHQNYMPDRIIVSAAGNVEHEDFTAQVRDAFWRMIGCSRPAQLLRPQFCSGVTVQEMNVSQVYFSIGLQGFCYTHPGRYALHLLNKVLGGGMSSRLFHLLREEKGLVYDIGSEYHAFGDGGVVVIEGSTTPEYFEKVLALALVELFKLITSSEPVNEEELWKAKMQIRSQFLISGEDTHTRMSRITTQEHYFGSHLPDDEILAQIDAIDIDELKNICRLNLLESLDRLAIAVVGPNRPDCYSSQSIENLWRGFY